MDDNENTIYQKQYDTPKVTRKEKLLALNVYQMYSKRRKPEQKGMSHTILNARKIKQTK